MQANSQKRRARKTALEFAGYVAPAVFFITLFVGIPFVMCIYYSFRKWNGIGKHRNLSDSKIISGFLPMIQPLSVR